MVTCRPENGQRHRAPPIGPPTGGLADHLHAVLPGTGYNADAVLAALTEGLPTDPSDALLAESHDGYTANTSLEHLDGSDNPDDLDDAHPFTATTTITVTDTAVSSAGTKHR